MFRNICLVKTDNLIEVYLSTVICCVLSANKKNKICKYIYNYNYTKDMRASLA